MSKHKLELFENLVDAFSAFPSIGKKTATRLAYYAIMEDGFLAMRLAHSLQEGVNRIQKCQKCHNMSEGTLCSICLDESRDDTLLCIVGSAKDILIIEESGEFKGRYYVISQLEDLNKEHLLKATKEVSEIIFAFPPSIASQTMILYIEEQLKEIDINFTKIAQGVPTGVELENIDSYSLSQALQSRIKT